MKIGKLFGFKEHQELQARPASASPKIDRPATSLATTASIPSLYRAVSIVHTGKCCQIAKDIGQKRFLAREAPPLPLPECALSGECTCRFRKHEDRRQNDERRGPGLTTSGIWYAGPERRQGTPRGRRSTDR